MLIFFFIQIHHTNIKGCTGVNFKKLRQLKDLFYAIMA